MSQSWQSSGGGRRNPVRPARLPSIPVFPKGPKLLDYTKHPKIGGFGPPPAGFITPSNSAVEWIIYWGLAKVFGDPKDPRKGPFLGSPGLWAYQRPYEGGATHGGTIIDFVISPSSVTRGRPMALRIVTERYHELVDPRKRAKDTVQKAALSTHYEVKDLHEVHFIADKSGQTAIKLLKHILAGGESPEPFRGGEEYLRIRDRT